MNKKAIRKIYLERRQKLEFEEIKKDSFLISKKVFEYIEENNIKSVFCYLSFKSEVITDDLIKRLLNKSFDVFVPRMIANTHEMEAIKISGFDNFEINNYGIREPIKNLSEIKETNNIELAIIPMVAFDDKCQRIGYGGGYYDRFLSRVNMKKVGIAFECQKANRIPTNEFDQVLDFIITEKSIYKPKT